MGQLPERLRYRITNAGISDSLVPFELEIGREPKISSQSSESIHGGRHITKANSRKKCVFRTADHNVRVINGKGHFRDAADPGNRLSVPLVCHGLTVPLGESAVNARRPTPRSS